MFKMKREKPLPASQEITLAQTENVALDIIADLYESGDLKTDDSKMAVVYTELIKSGRRETKNLPEKIKKAVCAELDKQGYDMNGKKKQ